MAKVTVSIPHLGLTYGGFEKNKEIYVLGFAIDGNPAGDKAATASSVTAAYNETLPSLAPEVADDAAAKWVFLTASNTFRRVSKNQPASLTGSGILLYPDLDPKGTLHLHFVVIECDSGVRNSGKVLEEILAAPEVKELVQLISQGINEVLIASLMSALIGQIPKALKKKKDDVLFTHSHSGFSWDNYGIDDGDSSYQDFELENDRCKLTMRVRVQ